MKTHTYEIQPSPELPSATAKTPAYVLLDFKTRIGPRIVEDAGVPCSAIYGFSNKAPYDLFCSTSPVNLTPFPLVCRYLESQIAEGNGLQLVVLDAKSAQEPLVMAATMQEVLAALTNKLEGISATHSLVYDAALQAYRRAVQQPAICQAIQSPAR